MTRNESAGIESALGVPAELVSAARAFECGTIEFSALRDTLANVLYLDFRSAPAIEAYLDALSENGDLERRLSDVLQSDVQRICTEDVPTLIDLELQSVARGGAAPARDDSMGGESSDGSHETADSLSASGARAIIRQKFPEVGDILAGRYELTERVEGGSMATVFRAIDRNASGVEAAAVAVKVLSARLESHGQALRAFQQEAEKAARIDHPSIVRTLGLERDGMRFFIVMEWLDGEPLSVALDRAPGVAWAWADCKRIIAAVGDALSCVHESGLIHADIKPGNVMLMSDGQVKLLDFGVARVSDGTKTAFDAGVLGAATPAYSSAELLSGKPPDASDDVYSFACIVYRLISGTRVYGTATALEARNMCLDPAPIERLGAAQWGALRAALSHLPERRPSLAQFLEALLQPANRRVPSWRPESAHLAATGLLLAALAVASVFFVQMKEGPEEQEGVEPVAFAAANPALPLAAQVPGASVDATTETHFPESGSAEPVSDVSLSPTISDIPETVVLVHSAEATVSEQARVRLAEGGTPHRLIFVRGAPFDSPARYRIFVRPAGEDPARLATINAVLPEHLEFAAGEASAAVDVAIPEDPDLFAPEAVLLSVAATAAPEEALALIGMDLVDPAFERLALDAPADAAGFTRGSIDVQESDAALRLTVVTSAPAAERRQIAYSLVPRSASQGEDYFAPAEQHVVIEPGRQRAVIYVPLVNDSLSEDTEQLMLRIEDAVAAPPLVSEVIVNIIDDDRQPR